MGLKPNDRSEPILRFPAVKAQSNQMFTDSEQPKLVNSRLYFDRPLSALEPAFGRRKSENAWIRMAAIQIQGLSRNKSQTPTKTSYPLYNFSVQVPPLATVTVLVFPELLSPISTVVSAFRERQKAEE